MMIGNNDYASLSSGYSSNVPSSAAWCDRFMQPLYRPYATKQQASSIEFLFMNSQLLLNSFGV